MHSKKKVPLSLLVCLENDLVDICVPGECVTIWYGKLLILYVVCVIVFGIIIIVEHWSSGDDHSWLIKLEKLC